MLKFTSEIISDVLFRASEPTDGSSDFAQAALDYVNRAYRAVWVGGGELIKDMNEPWLWLKKDPPGVLILNGAVTAGSVTVTQNSATATLSGAVSPSMAGRFLTVTGWPDMFRVIAHTSGTTGLTLDAGYTGVSGSFGYQLQQLEYTLATDMLRLISPMRVQGQNANEIQGCDLSSLDRDFPLSTLQTGVPNRFAVTFEASAAGGATKIRFNRSGGTSPTELYRVEYDYLQRPVDLTNSPSEECLVPLEFRQVLSDFALFNLMTSKSDQRAEAIGAQAKAGLRAMAAYNRSKLSQMGRNMGLISPRRRADRDFGRVLRTSSGFIIG